MENLAVAAGFEPANVDSKNRCNTKMAMPNSGKLKFIYLGKKISSLKNINYL